MAIKTFWTAPAGSERLWLRRYKGGDHNCPLPRGYHDEMVFLKDRAFVPYDQRGDSEDYDRPSDDDVRWPTHCACGYQFQPDDKRQLFANELYSGAPGGVLIPLRELPPGAMWDAVWLHDHEWATGPDGISLMVKLPNGHDWLVDQEASNCTKTQWHAFEEDGRKFRRWMGRTHYCWVRHGDPRTGMVHVDKSGNTCAAGAGSIVSGNYHGFLHNGYLTGV